MAMLPTNEIVARITGMKRELLDDSRSPASNAGSVKEESFSAFACPSPSDTLRGVTSQVQAEAHTRGDRADFAYDIPRKKARAVDSQDQKIPDHRMPDADADEMDGADLDDEQHAVGSKKMEAKSSIMNKKFFKECIGSMEEFRRYAGLPMVEMTVPEPRVGHSGEVPTSGVNKQNKMKGGLPGLEGEPLQSVEPNSGPGDEDEVGDAKEMTLDQAIAMLKKEGVDTEELWAQFLEKNGLTTEMFDQLMDEALETENEEDMDSLIAVEGLFMKELPNLLPEGLRELFGLKKKEQPDIMAPVRAAAATIRQHGAAAVRAANARGVAPDKLAPVPAAQASGGQSTRYQRSLKQTRRLSQAEIDAAKAPRRMAAEDADWTFEADHDPATGGPRMPWESSMSRLAGKYLSED